MSIGAVGSYQNLAFLQLDRAATKIAAAQDTSQPAASAGPSSVAPPTSLSQPLLQLSPDSLAAISTQNPYDFSASENAWAEKYTNFVSGLFGTNQVS